VSTLDQFIESARARVDRALDHFLPRSADCPPLLCEAVRYSVMAGGKRLRPILVLAAADAVARVTKQDDTALALPAACAVEFIHTYSLIHDDLPAMDDDTLRRGRPTLHVVYGDAMAILAGDALQAEAFALMAREPRSSESPVVARKVEAMAVMAAAAGAAGMVGGQAIDVLAANQVTGHQLTLDASTLRDMHARKTGALIQASARCGAIMGGGDRAAIDAISAWGAEIGLSFQIVDDILDVEGDAGQLGKTAGKDAVGQKPTYPSQFGLAASRQMAADCGDRAKGALCKAGLTAGWLDGLAAWVLTRRN
jgi:geranylgeranyl pyrophosphate synthase